MIPVRTVITLFVALALVACVAFPAPAIHPFDSPPGVSSISPVADSIAPIVQLAPDIAIRNEMEAEQAEHSPTIAARTIGEPMTEATSQYQRALYRTPAYGSHPLREHAGD